MLEDIQNQIDNVLTETMEKFDLDFQIRESEDILTKRFDKLCGKSTTFLIQLLNKNAKNIN